MSRIGALSKTQLDKACRMPHIEIPREELYLFDSACSEIYTIRLFTVNIS